MDGLREDPRVVPAVAAHVAVLAPLLREADRREVRAAFGRPAAEILWVGFRNAKRCWTVLAGARPVAMFGVGRRREPRIGTAWLLASPEFERFGARLRREGPYWIGVMMAGNDVLTNFVSADNRVAVRWLGWLGFELLALHRGAGLDGEDFWEFAAVRSGARARGAFPDSRPDSPAAQGPEADTPLAVPGPERSASPRPGGGGRERRPRPEAD